MLGNQSQLKKKREVKKASNCALKLVLVKPRCKCASENMMFFVLASGLKTVIF